MIYNLFIKKGKIRDERIDRDFKTVVKEIMIYETKWFLIIIVDVVTMLFRCS